MINLKSILLPILILPFILSAEFTNYSPQLSRAIHAVNQMDEVNEILQEVEHRIGPIQVELKPHRSKFNALWNPGLRAIQLNQNAQRSLSDNIISIVFELHNAKVTAQMDEVTQLARAGLISRLEYMETMERLEHINALSTKSIIQKGVARGIFPRNTYWNIPESFDVHFNLQKSSGHTAWFSTIYNQMASQMPRRPQEVDAASRRQYSEAIIAYVQLKDKLYASDSFARQEALRTVIHEWEKVQPGSAIASQFSLYSRQQMVVSKLFAKELRSAGILTS